MHSSGVGQPCTSALRRDAQSAWCDDAPSRPGQLPDTRPHTRSHPHASALTARDYGVLNRSSAQFKSSSGRSMHSHRSEHGQLRVLASSEVRNAYTVASSTFRIFSAVFAPIPGAAASSAWLAVSTARAVPKCWISAFAFPGPTPGKPSIRN